jgi:hypothetical protein
MKILPHIPPIPLTAADIDLLAAYYEARRKVIAAGLKNTGGRFSGGHPRSQGGGTGAPREEDRASRAVTIGSVQREEETALAPDRGETGDVH